MKSYKEFRPTAFDEHIEIDEHENWLVVPVGQNRDSGCLDKVNFEVALKMVGGESDNVEVHRFGHWGPGWFEIIIVRPDTDEAGIAEDIETRLADYPVLDDEKLSEAEYSDYCESWDDCYCQDFRQGLVDKFSLSESAESVLDDTDNDKMRSLYESLVNNSYESDSGGVYCDLKTALDDCTLEHLSDILGEYYTGLVEAVYSQAMLTGSPDIFDDVLRCRYDDKVEADVEALEAVLA